MAGDTSIHHNSFDPEMTGTMLEAMDSAWQQLAASGRVETMPFRASVTKERMATAILHEARKGVPDPQKLVAAAMMVILSEARFPAAQGNLPPVRSTRRNTRGDAQLAWLRDSIFYQARQGTGGALCSIQDFEQKDSNFSFASTPLAYSYRPCTSFGSARTSEQLDPVRWAMG